MVKFVKAITLAEDALAGIAEVDNEGALDDVVRRYIGKNGLIRSQLKQIALISPDRRKEFGQEINLAVRRVEEAAKHQRTDLKTKFEDSMLQDDTFDPTEPGIAVSRGTFHPITLINWRLEQIFEAMGFYVLDYPEIETEAHNFDDLNIPPNHPARDMQDTFWLDDETLLRTHTSAGQVRAMRQFTAPFSAIFPGRVFRHEATDASHEHTFHQVEGLFIDRQVSVANLVFSMKSLLSEIFERGVKVRLRPGYFPFVEPGFELDCSCLICEGTGCPVCKQSGWVELLPCGLVHPNVLRAGGLDPNEWQGWAFGLGMSRLVMMRYQIDDVRRLLTGDIRFLRQFIGDGVE